jgi:hypothetical protein
MHPNRGVVLKPMSSMDTETLLLLIYWQNQVSRAREPRASSQIAHGS